MTRMELEHRVLVAESDLFPTMTKRLALRKTTVGKFSLRAMNEAELHDLAVALETYLGEIEYQVAQGRERQAAMDRVFDEILADDTPRTLPEIAARIKQLSQS